MTTILTTTGISLEINTGKKYKVQEPTDDQIRQYLRTEPAAASAEANSLLQIAQSEDHLIFLHTDTPQAQRCAKLLEEFFSNDKGFQHIRLVKIEFQDDEKHIETHGLRHLVNTIIDEIEKAKRRHSDVVINATSGFKIEISYSTMIGMLYKVPVKYIHEKFRRIVTFNPIALDWDTSLFLTYNNFFKWIDEDARHQREVENRLKAFPDSDREKIQSMLTIPDENGDIFLSPVGEVLRRRFERETEESELIDWPEHAKIESAKDKIGLSLRDVKHHYPKGTLAICEKIAQLPWVLAVIGGNFENTTLSRLKNFNEDGTIRLLWADNEKATNLTVQTTAQGRPQTRKVAEKIRELLEIA